MSDIYFKQLNMNSSLSDNLLEKIRNTPESAWSGVAGRPNLIILPLEDLMIDQKIFQLVSDIGDTSRVAIYRFFGEECYSWHSDTIRYSAINMLLSGFENSICVFGDVKAAHRFVNITKLPYEPKKYYIMNVKKMHTVFNFGKEIRYVLSLGLPEVTYEDARAYLESHGLL
jgi:hypothetical protein